MPQLDEATAERFRNVVSSLNQLLQHIDDLEFELEHIGWLEFDIVGLNIVAERMIGIHGKTG